ncbi:hypothetical protein NZD85_04640 [Empedobacter stercoris]|uniref:Uncharacterized protein n=2 Tax=Empedobacter TaxID=59734 RepID=A0ABY8V8R7_9FLAO|nr:MULTISPECIES: hypothetical protein [Empedobacter]MCA4776197.1 hypothetical protein [Empedobacter stercoris]MCA4781537.1 hypothetical protein [Empedobacter stercoris]MCA4808660.1 hypothetical protein [Empedobacter stercoris]MDM1523614.1 hypothetical protein [Empedobacter sp. 225-1]MDM1543054.1 hypothetical protein [Empedobacter sp. 189-2]
MSATILEEKIFIDTELLTNIEEESQVIIHCCMNADEYANAARIWPSTFIIDNQSGKRCQLVFADGITMYPNWTYIEEKSSLNFTLIFNGLPKSCRSFDLVEIIPQAGGFEYRKINRNKSDVYHVEFSE